MKERLITAEELAALAADNTNAHRVWTGDNGWIERFGEDYLISAVGEAAPLVDKLAGLELKPERIFARQLVKQPGEVDKPTQMSGSLSAMQKTVIERGLKFGIDFEAGYSVGLFCDQRANRGHLESLRPKRMLNCFAYTCAFSVAAARAGAETLSLDLSRKSLDRGEANLALNGFAPEPHRLIADDVFAVLPRLARRGEKFDTIILDPPTFSRGAKGKVFRAERDLDALLEFALDVATSGAWILLSTNARELDLEALERIARGLKCLAIPPPPEYPPGTAATTLWVAAP